VLIGCALVALLGTLGVIGGLIKVSGTISSYGGTLGAPVFVGFLLMLLSVWLFAAAMYWIPKLNIGLAVIALLVTGFGGFKVYQGNDRGRVVVADNSARHRSTCHRLLGQVDHAG
jgi:hypothetical protein